MTQPQQPAAVAPAPLALRELLPRFTGLVHSLLFSVVLPLVAVQILERLGLTMVAALSIAAVFPAAETVFSWRKTGRLDLIGAISFASIFFGVAGSLISGDVRFALVKESSITGLFGLASLGSLRLTPRPLMFYLGREFIGAGDAERLAEWERRWRTPFIQTMIRVLTGVWGACYLLEAGARIAAAYTLPPELTVVVSPLLATVVTFALVLWSVAYGRKLMF